MTDFPTALTNAQDNVTDVLAKHLNNLEEKVGIDESAVTDSLDYLAKHPMEEEDANTVLLCHFDGDDEAQVSVDHATGKALTFVADAKIDTAQYKFAPSSAFFDGTGDAISLIDSADWTFGTGDFTIDFWARWNAYDTADYYGFVGQYEGNDDRWVFYQEGTKLILLEKDGGNVNVFMNPAWTPVVDTWYHIALTRSGNFFRIFVDGTQVGDTLEDASAMANHTGLLRIGANMYNSIVANVMTGWIDELRIVKGVAKWAADFDVPRKPYKIKSVGLTEITNETISTGVGSVKMGSASARTNTGFLKIITPAGPRYIPYFTDITG